MQVCGQAGKEGMFQAEEQQLEGPQKGEAMARPKNSESRAGWLRSRDRGAVGSGEPGRTLHPDGFAPTHPRPLGTFVNVWRHSALPQLGNGVLLVSTSHRTAPTTKIYPTQKVRSAEGEGGEPPAGLSWAILR